MGNCQFHRLYDMSILHHNSVSKFKTPILYHHLIGTAMPILWQSHIFKVDIGQSAYSYAGNGTHMRYLISGPGMVSSAAIRWADNQFVICLIPAYWLVIGSDIGHLIQSPSPQFFFFFFIIFHSSVMASCLLGTCRKLIWNSTIRPSIFPLLSCAIIALHLIVVLASMPIRHLLVWKWR